jgi:hypothetical protein
MKSARSQKKKFSIHQNLITLCYEYYRTGYCEDRLDTA